MIDAHSNPLTGISSMAVRDVLGELAAAYARETAVRVEIVAVGGVDAARRINAGEPFDFVVLASDAIDKLADSARIDASSRVDVARSGIAVAVRAGASQPDIATESALRDAFLRAHNVGYSTGPSGRYLLELLARWGIAGQLEKRLVQAPPGVPVASLVAQGDVEIGFQQLSELVHAPEIVVVGTLPAAVQSMTTFTAAVCRASSQPERAKAFLAFLASPRADDAKRRQGMNPL